MNSDTQRILNKYSDVFKGLGELPGEIKLQIGEQVHPKKQAQRRIPISLRQELQQTLNEMETIGVIKRENNPTQ